MARLAWYEERHLVFFRWNGSDSTMAVHSYRTPACNVFLGLYSFPVVSVIAGKEFKK